ncbi:Non-specific serine/threonine protein kinase [Heracleum sosnowskyi]|uniref:non-specific serine/threonine protein kinase n=1 Tax=Heracleum sosnowskyi TaxID=360622 RepID=A0AAD8I7L1_9APIA|nr:Non-specific serine/threonine protein kinase [Heracleum sosnowskyi]
MNSNKTPQNSLKRTTSGGGSGGIIFEKYQLGHILGRGSFAKVYYGRSLQDNSSVAIKVIEKPSNSDPNMELRLIREVSAMRRLNNHPNILKLHEVMATKTKIYLVMELAKGGELFTKLLRRGRLSESTCRTYFQQLVSTVHFCHQNGVAHRDLKPQNLLLDGNGNLKVSDFGLSALPEQIRGDGMLHTACGTPVYTAPEVVRRNGYDGAKADAWSCGVILFVMLVGDVPFRDSNIANLYKKICRREINIPVWISTPAQNIIHRLLDPNPNTRMGVDGIMGLSWFKKSLQPGMGSGSDPENELGSLLSDDEKSGNEIGMNAFDIISMSPGLDLSGFFYSGQRKERRFVSRGTMREVEERVLKVGEELGYKVEKGKGKEMVGLVKGKVVLLVKMAEVGKEMELWIVEIRVVSGNEGVDFEWEDFKLGLGDIVVS